MCVSTYNTEHNTINIIFYISHKKMVEQQPRKKKIFSDSLLNFFLRFFFSLVLLFMKIKN